MKKIVILASVISFAFVLSVSIALAKNDSGVAQDPNYSQLGDIKYLFNPQGYHFWFTPAVDLGPYIAGHSYHNVYKYDLEDPSDWCGPVNIPNRLPYNAGGTAGSTAYYKIWDDTAGVYVCGSE